MAKVKRLVKKVKSSVPSIPSIPSLTVDEIDKVIVVSGGRGSGGKNPVRDEVIKAMSSLPVPLGGVLPISSDLIVKKSENSEEKVIPSVKSLIRPAVRAAVCDIPEKEFERCLNYAIWSGCGRAGWKTLAGGKIQKVR